MRPWIQTFTGVQFTFPAEAENVNIFDIAHALAYQCRYTGHVVRFYSVAEHCCLLHDYAKEAGYRNVRLRAILLHDAVEAYICDLPAPVKNLLPDYRELERSVQAAVTEAFHLRPLTDLLKELDARIVRDEVESLLGAPPASWNHHPKGRLGVAIRCWSPGEAEYHFLRRAKEIDLA